MKNVGLACSYHVRCMRHKSSPLRCGAAHCHGRAARGCHGCVAFGLGFALLLTPRNLVLAKPSIRTRGSGQRGKSRHKCLRLKKIGFMKVSFTCNNSRQFKCTIQPGDKCTQLGDQRLYHEIKHFQEGLSCCFAPGPSPPAGNDRSASCGYHFGVPVADAAPTESRAPCALADLPLWLGTTVTRLPEPVRAYAWLLLSRTRPRWLVHSRVDGHWACSGPCYYELSCLSLFVGKSCPCFAGTS